MDGIPEPVAAVVSIWCGKPGKALSLLDGTVDSNPLGMAVFGLACLELGLADKASDAWKKSPPHPWRICAARSLAALMGHHRRLEPEKIQERVKEDLKPTAWKNPPRFLRLLNIPLKVLLTLFPDSGKGKESFHRREVNSMLMAGRLDEAINLSRRLRKEFKGEAWPSEILAELLELKGDDESLSKIRAAGKGMNARVGLANARLGKWDEAIGLLKKAREEDPEDPFIHYAIGCYFSFERDVNEGARSFLRLHGIEEMALVEVLEREVAFL